MIKINHLKYVELFTTFPSWDMLSCGWEYKKRVFLGIPYVIYTKTWIK